MRVPSQEALDHLESKVLPDYPAMGIAAHIQNNEALKIVIDEQGQVVDAQVHSGHPAFAQASLDAVKQWKYRPFLLNGAPVRVEAPVFIEYRLEGLEDHMPASSPNAAASCVVKAAAQGGDDSRFMVKREITDEHRTKYVEPKYPQMARVARIQGEVVLNALIDKQGNIANVRPVSGHPILVQAAMDAVKQWTYEPYLLNGEPVEVESMIHVLFQLPAQEKNQEKKQ